MITLKWLAIAAVVVVLAAAIILSGGIYTTVTCDGSVIVTNRFTGETWAYYPAYDPSCNSTRLR